jgi:hypothetical protein
MRRRFSASAVAGVLCISCASTSASDSARVAEVFGSAELCPPTRVVVKPMPELRLAPPLAPPLAPSLAPPLAEVRVWDEATAPEDIARDPERMRMRSAKRSAAYAAWQRETARARKRADAVEAAYRAMPVYSVSGCGMTMLYACRDNPRARGRQPSRPCDLLDAIGHVRLLCTNGAVLRFVDGLAEC